MRVRILKDFITASRSFRAGEVADIDPRKADGWLRAGLIMEDKSLDGAGETKEPPPLPPPGPEVLIEKGFPRKPKKTTSTKRKTGR